jgi:RNA polymerase subunit RPABC4/transcription elongation factor Spt4
MDIEQHNTCRYCGVELDENSTCPLCGEFYGVAKAGTTSVPVRSQMPTAVVTDESGCKVCGHIIDDDSATCPMCNSPVLSQEEEEPEFRCPVCENPLEMDATTCSFCEVDLQGKEDEKKEMSYRCPACQETMQIDDHQCKKCGAKIWLDLEEEVRRIEEYRCPMCAQLVEEDSEKCPKCGADVWMRDEGSLLEEATTKIEEAETQIKIEEKETNSDLSNAIRFLTVAKKAIEMSDYGRASKCASLSLDLARSAGLQKRLLVDALMRAEKTVTLVDEKGGDVVKAMELLKSSKDEVRKGNYKKALKMAIRGKVLAESNVGQEAVLMIDADSLE